VTALGGALALVCAAKDGTSPEHPPTGASIFEGHGDVGNVLHAGSVEYDAAKRSYTIAGSGENMWFASDAFQFTWKKVSGDVTLTADVSFFGKGVNEHRKAVLMIRQSLDADSPLRGRGAARQRFDFAAISRGEGRGHARNPDQHFRACAIAN